ncbi:MAG: SprT family zinc-dependent metalloprotease [Vicinamibacterales bacterium]
MSQQLPLFDRPDADLGSVAPPPPAALPLLPALPLAAIDFVRSPRARRYILRIRPDGSLRVTVPRWGSKREARDFVARQERWIARERQRVLQEQGSRDWQDGSEIWLRGERVLVAVSPARDGIVVSYGDRRVVARSDAEVRAVVETDLRRLAHEELEPRLRALAVIHDLTPGRVSIRNQRSRWGSCARGGNIALNFRLVQMPPPIRDYVLLHELMHLRQQNHSSRFWRLVEQACPGFKDAERWLRIQGKALF